MKDIHDIEPPVPVGMDPFFIHLLMGVGVVLLLGILGLFLFRYIKRRKQRKMSANILLLPPPPPPDQAAIKALDALDHIREKDPRHYYFAISAILKTFMGKVFNMRAPEMTTQEVVASLSGLDLDRGLTVRIRDFFLYAAMVKYAGITPDAPRIHKDHDLVLEFIISTTGSVEDPAADSKASKKETTVNNADSPENGMDTKNAGALTPGPGKESLYMKKRP